MAESESSGKTADDTSVSQQPLAPSEPESLGFPVVGIGASAGGIGAFESFFSTMPADGDPGVAFVLVQHLARDHKSLLSDLIRRYTKMQVFEVEDGMPIQANCAYIIPPNRDIALANGVLHLSEPSLARGVRLPIDFFFRSLAQDQRERAICIVLSGTGSDGTLGVRAVKGEGGMVMVQMPETTEYDGMPRSAIATGMVDFILPPNEMPDRLLAYAGRAFGTSPVPASLQHAEAPNGLQKIFHLLRSQTGHDFSGYKRSTVTRRIERRMAVHQIDQIGDYLRYLQLTRHEVDALFHELLIGVTNFFRDSEIFDTLQKKVIPKLVAANGAGDSIRIWVPACSTGEEAYSIAMLFREYMEETKVSFKVQVFATDIDREAIEEARAGVYPSSIVADVSAERLAHFFEQDQPDGDTYRIRKTVRDMLVFSEHDLIRDPPFSKVNFISCRNLLIYMGPELQKKLMRLFHYALKPEGILVLGSSESVGESVNLYATLDRGAKIYQRKADEFGPHRLSVSSLFPRVPGVLVERQEGGSTISAHKFPLHEIAERTLIMHYAPVGALVTERGDILYLLGRTGEYLEPAPGEASMNIFRMAREGLRRDLTVALHRAVSVGVVTRHHANAAAVNLTVIPVPPDSDGLISSGLFLVIFEALPAIATAFSTGGSGLTVESADLASLDLNEYIIRLKQELRAKDEHLQAVIEELESSNEELRSAHEEMQSVNEEMQSTNEELETSKEELQSVNEELSTVNSELQAKVAELSRSNSDMKNLLSGTGIGTVFVDHSLRILRFTPTVSALINLIESDIGRPLDQIRSNLVGYDGLAADLQDVLTSLIPKEREVQTNTGEWYLLRIRPYRTLDNVIEGVVITFTDYTAMKHAEAALADSEAARRLAVVVRDARDAILVLDMTGRILAWNPGAEKMYGWSESEALAMNIRELVPQGDRDAVLAGIQRHCREGILEPQRQKRIAKTGEIIDVSVIASALVNDAGNIYAIATTERA